MKLPHEWWGSCHVVTEGAAMQSIAVTLQFINYQLTKNSNLVTQEHQIKQSAFSGVFRFSWQSQLKESRGKRIDDQQDVGSASERQED